MLKSTIIGKDLVTMEKMNAPKVCPACGDEMILEVASYPMGSAFHKNRFHVDIYLCPKCDRVKLYAAKSHMVACPVCGSTHPIGERCIVCALNAAGVGSEKREKKAARAEETGVGQVEAGFLDESPLSLLAAASAGPGVSPGELKHQLEEVGVKVPEKPVREKAEHAGHSGVDSVEEGFLAEPEMSPVEELGAIRYAASPEEIHQEIETVEGEGTPSAGHETGKRRS